MQQFAAALHFAQFHGAGGHGFDVELQFFAPALKFRRAHQLAMGFVQTLGQGQKKGKNPHGLLPGRSELRENFVFGRSPLAVKIDRGSQHIDFLIREAQQFLVPDQIMAVGMVVLKGNENAHVMQQARVTQKFATALAAFVQPQAGGAVEKHQGQIGHVAGVALLKAAEAAQLQHALLPRGNALGEDIGPGPHQIVQQNAVLQAAVADADALHAQLNRQNAIESLGYSFIRVKWNDLLNPTDLYNRFVRYSMKKYSDFHLRSSTLKSLLESEAVI